MDVTKAESPTLFEIKCHRFSSHFCVPAVALPTSQKRGTVLNKSRPTNRWGLAVKRSTKLMTQFVRSSSEPFGPHLGRAGVGTGRARASGAGAAAAGARRPPRRAPPAGRGAAGDGRVGRARGGDSAAAPSSAPEASVSDFPASSISSSGGGCRANRADARCRVVRDVDGGLGGVTPGERAPRSPASSGDSSWKSGRYR